MGLRRRTVRLVEHQATWATAFDELADDIIRVTALPHERISHVGSTSVIGLVAKPILDVAILAESRAETIEIARLLAANGFIDRGDGEGSIGRLVLLEPEPDVRSVHIHILDRSQPFWDDYHRFRSLLRRDGEARREYATVKLELAERFKHDRAGYTTAKGEYVSRVVEGLGLEEVDPIT